MSNGGQNMEYEYKEKKRSWFFGLPLSFTTYTVSQKKINIKKGLLRTEEDDSGCKIGPQFVGKNF